MGTATASTADLSTAIAKKKALEQSFFKKGVAIGLFSSVMYGLYTAFLTAAQNAGIWVDWFANLEATSFLVIFILPAIASGLNDTCSAIWALAITIKQGKLADFGRTLRTKPGAIMIGAAAVGGPIASIAYVVAISQAGPIVIPIAALCPAIGSILSRILYKQLMGPRVIAGICVCAFASGMIGMTSLTGEAQPGMVTGLILAFVAALGWGAEGCIAGYGTSMIDSQIGITIRQVTSGVGNLLIAIPILAIAGGLPLGEVYGFVGTAIADIPSIVFFAVSGLCAYFSFSSWYRANSMCGTALGMALNGTYSFTAPLCTWIILGIVMGVAGYSLAPVAWLAAFIMVCGIFLIAVNPLDFFRKERAA